MQWTVLINNILHIAPPSCPTNLQVPEFTSRSASLSWGPPVSNGGADITGYIIEKRLAGSPKWEKVITLEPNVFQHTIENLKEKNEFVFRVFAENAIGMSTPANTQVIALKRHASTFLIDSEFNLQTLFSTIFCSSCTITTHPAVRHQMHWTQCRCY